MPSTSRGSPHARRTCTPIEIGRCSRQHSRSTTPQGSYFRFATGKNVTQKRVSTDTPMVIPDNHFAVAASTIVVPDNTPVQKVTVTVNITHPFDGDLVLTHSHRRPALRSRSRTAQPLRRGANFIDTGVRRRRCDLDRVRDTAVQRLVPSGSAPLLGHRDRTRAGCLAAQGPRYRQRRRRHDRQLDAVLTVPVPCGPEYQSHALVADTCCHGGRQRGRHVGCRRAREFHRP